MTVESATRELYALPLAEFTKRRNAAARDEPTVKTLPKPSVSAWSLNMLSLRQPDAFDPIVELADELRTAQQSGDRTAMVDLARTRRRTIASVTSIATELAESLGQRISGTVREEIESTLQAAMSSPDAAAAVTSGLLVHAITADGLDTPDLSGAVIGTHSPRKTSAGRTGPDPAIGRARDAVAATTSELEKADAVVADAERRRGEAAAVVAAARRALDEAQEAAASVDRDLRAAKRERDTVTRRAERAQRELARLLD